MPNRLPTLLRYVPPSGTEVRFAAQFDYLGSSHSSSGKTTWQEIKLTDEDLNPQAEIVLRFPGVDRDDFRDYAKGDVVNVQARIAERRDPYEDLSLDGISMTRRGNRLSTVKAGGRVVPLPQLAEAAGIWRKAQYSAEEFEGHELDIVACIKQVSPDEQKLHLAVERLFFDEYTHHTFTCDRPGPDSFSFLTGLHPGDSVIIRLVIHADQHRFQPRLQWIARLDDPESRYAF